MNYRAILKVYKDERKLTDDETAFLNTLRKMNENEIVLLIESLSDKPQKKAGKKAGKKSASKSSGKSVRASSLAEKVGGTLASIAKTAGGNDENTLKILNAIDNSDDDTRCQFTRADNKPCHLLPDHNVHHLQHAMDYHPFVPPAQPADGLSSASNAATGSTASSETGKGAAGNAAGGSNG